MHWDSVWRDARITCQSDAGPPNLRYSFELQSGYSLLSNAVTEARYFLYNPYDNDLLPAKLSKSLTRSGTARACLLYWAVFLVKMIWYSILHTCLYTRH